MIPVFGHEAQARAILTAARSGRMHHAWLLTGPEGVGKARFANAVAARLLAEATAAKPEGDGLTVPEDHPTARLIAAGSHPDLLTLTRLANEKTGDLARNISVDQVRQLGTRFAQTPSQSAVRVVIIDAAEDMERSSANALLKSLEEPPASTIFLLVSHVPGRLLPTIRSRCSVLRFSPLDDRAMTSVLSEALPEEPPGELATLIAAAQGLPGRALRLAGLNMAEIDQALEQIARTGDPSNAQRAKLALQLSLKSAQPRYEAFLARAPVIIARLAKDRTGPALAAAIGEWESARTLASGAIGLSLDQHSTVFALAGHVAALAPEANRAKA